MFAASPRLAFFSMVGDYGSCLEKNLIPGNNRGPAKDPNCRSFIYAARKNAGNGRDVNIQRSNGQRYDNEKRNSFAGSNQASSQSNLC